MLGCYVLDHAQVQVCLLVLLVSFGLDWLFAMREYLITLKETSHGLFVWPDIYT